MGQLKQMLFQRTHTHTHVCIYEIKKGMKRYSVSLIFREMQIEATIRYQLATIKELPNKETEQNLRN